MTDKKRNKDYVTQPYQLTTLRGDLNKSQTQILVGMTEILQDRINSLMQRKENSAAFAPEDLDANGNVCIDIPLHNISSRPDEYRDIDKVAPLIVDAKTKIDRGDSIEYMNAFTSVIVPKSRGKKGRRLGYVRVIMSPYQANTLFDLKRYSRYLVSVTKASSSVYTSRLYQLLSLEKFRGCYRIEYKELRNFLGCNIYNNESKEWEDKKYQVYKNFKYRVLMTAENELKSLADDDKSDFYFTHKEIFEGKANLRTNPRYIEFTIYLTEMGKAEAEYNKKTARHIEYERFMIESFTLSKGDCKQILDKVSDDMLEQFREKMHELNAVILKKEGIKDKKAYTMTCLRKIVDDLTPIIEDIKPHTEDKVIANDVDDTRSLKEEKEGFRKLLLSYLRDIKAGKERAKRAYELGVEEWKRRYGDEKI